MSMTLELLTVRPLPATDEAREACTPDDAEALGPIVGGLPTMAEMAAYTEAAKQMCAVCPLRDACSELGDRYAGQGVWGGSLRYRAGGPHGDYVVVPLIPDAPVSIHERRVS